MSYHHHSNIPTESNPKQFYTKSFKRSIYQEAKNDEPPRKRSKPNSSFNFDTCNANSMQHIHFATKYNANNNNNNNNNLNNTNNHSVYITINQGKIRNKNNNKTNIQSPHQNQNQNKNKNENINIKNTNINKNNNETINNDENHFNPTYCISNANPKSTISLFQSTNSSLPHYSQNLSNTQIQLEADKIIRKVFLSKPSSSIENTNNKPHITPNLVPNPNHNVTKPQQLNNSKPQLTQHFHLGPFNITYHPASQTNQNTIPTTPSAHNNSNDSNYPNQSKTTNSEPKNYKLDINNNKINTNSSKSRNQNQNKNINNNRNQNKNNINNNYNDYHLDRNSPTPPFSSDHITTQIHNNLNLNNPINDINMVKPYIVDILPNLPQQSTVSSIHLPLNSKIEQSLIQTTTTKNPYANLASPIISPSPSSVSISPTIPISTITSPITIRRKNDNTKLKLKNDLKEMSISIKSNKIVSCDSISITDDDGKLDILPASHTNQSPITFNDLQQSDLNIIANYSLTSSPIIPHNGNTLQYGIDLFSTKLIDDSTNQLLNNIDYQWFNVTQFNNNDPTIAERQKFKLNSIITNGKIWWYTPNYIIYTIPPFFKFITQFQKYLKELVKRIDQLYFFLTFKAANKIPFYIKKWWYTYKTFTSNDKSHTNFVNHLLLKRNKTQQVSNQLLHLISKSDKPINFFNFIIFRTKKRIKAIIQTIDIIFTEYNKIPDIFGIFNFKLLEFIPILHKQRLSLRLKLINNMFFELPSAFLGPFGNK